jgi:predicted ATP-grasp superfamily ATP-dependent carboligase
MAATPAAVLLGDLNMLRCFIGVEFPVILATTDPADITLASRFVTHREIIAPYTETEQVLADLERIAAAQPTKPVLFYGTDQQLLLISRNRERLARSYLFRMPSAEIIEAMVDKRGFAQRTAALGLPVPATASSRDVTSADDVLARVPVPCVIKPNVHIGWFKYVALHATGPRKALVANTADELRMHFAEVARHTPDFVIQQYIPGGEELIYSFHAYVDPSGRVLAEFAGKKIRTFPREAGISTYLELVKAPRVLAIGREVVTKLGLVGPMKIDMKMHADTGELFVLEVNARFNLWHYLGTESGINLPLLAYAELTGAPLPPPPTDYATDIKWLSFSDDFRSFLRSYRPAGDLTWLTWLASFRGRKIYDVFSWRDPKPWASAMLDYGRALRKRLMRAKP